MTSTLPVLLLHAALSLLGLAAFALWAAHRITYRTCAGLVAVPFAVASIESFAVGDTLGGLLQLAVTLGLILVWRTRIVITRTGPGQPSRPDTTKVS